MRNSKDIFEQDEFKESAALSYLTLAKAVQGRKYKIDRILGGHGINSRLLAVGFLPGEIISVINKSEGGPLTVTIKGSKIALGRGISQKILVQELEKNING